MGAFGNPIKPMKVREQVAKSRNLRRVKAHVDQFPFTVRAR